MYNKLYNALVIAYIIQSDPIAFVKSLECGDADSSGSTLRTVGVVALVLIVVAVLGYGIYIAANRASTTIAGGNFSFGTKPGP